MELSADFSIEIGNKLDTINASILELSNLIKESSKEFTRLITLPYTGSYNFNNLNVFFLYGNPSSQGRHQIVRRVLITSSNLATITHSGIFIGYTSGGFEQILTTAVDFTQVNIPVAAGYTCGEFIIPPNNSLGVLVVAPSATDIVVNCLVKDEVI